MLRPMIIKICGCAKPLQTKIIKVFQSIIFYFIFVVPWYILGGTNILEYPPFNRML